MSIRNKLKKDGVSLRTLYGWLIVLTVIVSGLMVFSTYHLSSTFLDLSGAMDEYIELEKAANEMMDASDYLTEKVQRFTVDGRMEYLNEYFKEANETNRREHAIEKMSENPNSAAALEQLQEALEESRYLMNQEYYAMKLVIEAKGYTDYPKILDEVELTDADTALSPEDKMRRATETVLNEEYYEKKDIIRLSMQESLEELEKLTRGTEQSTADELRSELELARVIILIQTLGIFAVIWLTSILGINPVLKAVDRIRDDSTIPEVGANEFRYLARTYNKMYNVYKRSVEHLNFKASHDELTGVYNRAGYDLLLSSMDLSTTYLLLVDVDDFKLVNDSYGHETGDLVLRRVADTLKSNFRSDDYVCRIGGDEFVVFMVHSDEKQQKLLVSKVEQINAELERGEGGLPPVTVSVGIAHGKQTDTPAALFERTDEAMYAAKRNGKHGYAFYMGPES